MSHPTSHPSTARARLVLNLLLALTVAAVAVVAVLAPHRSAAPTPASATVPHGAAMETATGVRFSRVAVVGDGGLVTVFYVVLDPERATAFQSDREHPPSLRSEARTGGTRRASIMRAGHLMRPGQTYYLVYENTDGAIRPGEQVTISYGGHRLQHVPVL